MAFKLLSESIAQWLFEVYSKMLEAYRIHVRLTGDQKSRAKLYVSSWKDFSYKTASVNENNQDKGKTWSV